MPPQEPSPPASEPKSTTVTANSGQASTTPRGYDYAQPSTLKLLLSDLREAEFPEKGPMQLDDYQDRLKWKVDEWILLTYRAVLLDRICKERAEKHEDWVGRDKSDAASLSAISEVVSPHSGFMVTASPATRFDDVPLCVEVREAWESFLIELRNRLQRWEEWERKDATGNVQKRMDDYVKTRIGGVKREHLGPGIDDETWRVAEKLEKEVRGLLADGQLKRELEAVRKAIAADAKGNP